jgi:TolB-like protein
MHFRIGVNLGDIREAEDGTVYGDGVNVAARLEGLASPGGVMLSESAHLQVRRDPTLNFANAGKHDVKNIAEPVQAFQILPDGAMAPKSIKARHRLIMAGAAVVLIAIFAGFGLWPSTEPEAPETAEAIEDSILVIPAGPKIAVLPFENLSGAPDEEYFSDGISEEIITALTQFRDLFVIARNSSFQYKDQADGVRSVGEALGVDYILEGSVRRAQGAIRVTAKLTEIETGAHLWAQTYERDLTVGNIFAVQDEITEQIVARIAEPYGVITRAGLRASEHKSTDSLDAYECVLHAREWFGTEIPEQFPSARECMERAVVLDPGYGEAWAWLALLNARQFGYALDGPSQPPPLDRALEAAQRAIQLEPESAMA